MTTNKKAALAGTCTASNTADTLDFIAIVSPVGWRGALAMADGRFRIKGTYDAPADARRMRRMLERQAKKAALRGVRK